MMRTGSLFTGIGGLDLGLQRAGFEIAWQVEIDPFCLRLLGQRWPEVKKHRDIRECGAHNLAEVDLIVGGFPCQDISTAGKLVGIEGERSGLWREQARIIAEIRPCYCVIENVAALLYATKGPDGRKRPAAIQRVLRDLAERGYDAQWRVCSAAEFGAPHLRKRVFIVAYLSGERGRARRTSSARQPGQTNANQRGTADVGNSPGAGQQEWRDTTRVHRESDASSSKVANTDSDRQRQWKDQPEPGTKRTGTANAGEDGDNGQMADASCARRAAGGDTGRPKPPGEAQLYEFADCGKMLADASSAGLEKRNGSTEAQAQSWAAIDKCGRHRREAESPICRIFDGFPPRLDEVSHRWPAGPGQEQFEWEPTRVIQGRLPNRVARLKGLGNAALPQIAEAIGWGIQEHNAEQQRDLEVDKC